MHPAVWLIPNNYLSTAVRITQLDTEVKISELAVRVNRDRDRTRVFADNQARETIARRRDATPGCAISQART